MGTELLEAALEHLAGEIERVEWNRTQEVYEAPISNNGGKYETEVFKMRAFCWCDGERHKDGCPPNFEWNGHKVEWYKYLGRGMNVEPEMTPNVINTMLKECLVSVRKRDVLL